MAAIHTCFTKTDSEMSPVFMSLCCHPLIFAQRGLWGTLARRHFESILWHPSTLHPTSLSEIINWAARESTLALDLTVAREALDKSPGRVRAHKAGLGSPVQTAEGKLINEERGQVTRISHMTLRDGRRNPR